MLCIVTFVTTIANVAGLASYFGLVGRSTAIGGQAGEAGPTDQCLWPARATRAR